MLCCPFPACDWLLLVSKQLLNKDPNKHPMMLEVLQWMPNFDTVEIPHDGHFRYLLTHIFLILAEEARSQLVCFHVIQACHCECLTGGSFIMFDIGTMYTEMG